MTVTVDVRAELATLNPSSIIELYEVTTCTRIHGVCEVYRFHAGVNAKQITGHVVWAGNTYYAWPVEAEGFEYTGNGAMPRPRIRIANVDASITAVLPNSRSSPTAPTSPAPASSASAPWPASSTQ